MKKQIKQSATSDTDKKIAFIIATMKRRQADLSKDTIAVFENVYRSMGETEIDEIYSMYSDAEMIKLKFKE